MTVEDPRPERADAARNRRAILDAAGKLLAERGANNVSIEEIAAAAGVGKGTVFHRFGSRVGLLRELVMERAESLRSAVASGEPPLGPGAPARERLLAFFAAWADFTIENFELYAAYSTDIDDDPRAEEFHAFWCGHIAALLGETRPGIVDADVQARLLFFGTFASPVSFQLFRAGEGPRLKAAALAIVDAVASSP
ncbi:MAG TPA: TetR/AcrR family transcriptional regulator [Nocardioidaceae bacterium]|nr:TetR/AcrR family transcriptional regulator [Nocardioidaceae bacterium]